MTQRRVALLAVLTFALWLGGPVGASAAVLSNGSGIFLGVNPGAHLNVIPLLGEQTVTNSSRVGVAATFPDGSVRDATSPGCFCEGWGASGNATAGFISIDNGTSNISVDSFVSGVSTATSVTHLTLLANLQVTHLYQPSSDARLFQGVVTIKNLGAGTITDVRYRRVMDWDIPPTEFSEFVTIGGLPAAAVIDAGNDGFEAPNPLVDVTNIGGCPEDANFTDCGPFDHGASFTFGFGDLAPGAETIFSIFYGAATNEAGALTALGEVGAEIFSFGQRNSSDRNSQMTYIFAFAGVGGTPLPDPTPGGAVPGPASLILVGAGLAGVAALRRVLGRK